MKRTIKNIRTISTKEQFDSWEWAGDSESRPVCEPIKFVSGTTTYYGVSPDGQGAYYYDTLEDLTHDFGDLDAYWYEQFPNDDCQKCEANQHQMS